MLNSTARFIRAVRRSNKELKKNFVVFRDVSVPSEGIENILS